MAVTTVIRSGDPLLALTALESAVLVRTDTESALESAVDMSVDWLVSLESEVDPTVEALVAPLWPTLSAVEIRTD